MMVNGMLAGLVAITAPSGFVGPLAAVIIGAVAGLLVCLAIPFFDKRRIDDPVGAISVHGVNGLWGVLALGIFADGTANYAGYSPKGLLYGDTGQFVAQVIGAAVAFAWAFGASYVFFKVLNKFMPLRTPPRPRSPASTSRRWAAPATPPTTSDSSTRCSRRPEPGPPM